MTWFPTSDTWDDAKTAELIRLWDLGHPAGVVARQLGVSRNAVIGKVNRLRKQGKIARASQSRAEMQAAAIARRAVALANRRDRDVVAQEVGMLNAMRASADRALRRALRAEQRERQAEFAAQSPWLPLPGIEPKPRTEAKRTHCQWPITVDGDDLSHCCGAETSGWPYCKTHHLRALGEPAKVKASNHSHAQMIFGRAA